jgi:putative transposase
MGKTKRRELMQRTNTIQLMPNKKQKSILKECMLLSSCVYNMANYLVRQAIFNKKKVPSFFDLQQMLQDENDYKALGRSYALPRIQIYSETNSARFKLIKAKVQEKVGLPKYLKNRKTNTTIPSYLVVDGCQYHLDKNKITIPLSRSMRKKHNLKNFKINYNGILKWKGSQKRGQIHFKDNKFYFYQSVELLEPRAVKSGVCAGIDLGIKKLFAIKISNGEEKLIGRKRHFKQWNYYTNIIADEQSKLSKINRKMSRRLTTLFSLRSKFQNNLYNNLTASAFKFLRKNNVDTIYIGDVQGIRTDADWGRRGNKMLHNYWAYDLLYRKIANKAEEYGIRDEYPTEEYTSQTCPICGDRDASHKKDRIFMCSFCEYFGHRDLVGATNILNKGMHSLQSVHQGEIVLLRGCSNATA